MPDRARNMVQGLNIASWEYGPTCKYARVLCIAKFWIWQDSQHTSALNIWGLWNTTDADPETSAELSGNKTYLKFFLDGRMQTWGYFWKILNGSACLAMAPNMPEFCTRQGSQYMNFGNMKGFWICQGSEFVRVLNILG